MKLALHKWLLLGLTLMLSVFTPHVASAASVTLTWTDNSTNEDGFHVQRKAEDCLGPTVFVELAHVLANTVTYIDATVVEGARYCFRVNAFNSAGESAWSNSAGTTVYYSAASAPTGLAVTPTGVLTWTDKTANESGFVVERKSVACALTGNFSSITTTLPSATTYTDNAVAQGQTYCYRVAAMNVTGMSPFSNTAERIVPLVVPAAPSQLGAVAGP